jgi:hypothetical protein
MNDDVRTPRRPWWPVLAVLSVLLVLASLLVPPGKRHPPAAVRAGFDRIEYGMTEGDVEALLGVPRGVHDPARAHSRLAAVAA